MRVTFVTTSFPITENSSSGIFIARLVEALSKAVTVQVITPCADSPPVNQAKCDFVVTCFQYAPNKWQVLAQQPGGIPAALNKNTGLYFLVPSFLVSMFFACAKQAKTTDIFHAHWSVCGVIAGAVGKLLHVPVITTLRGSDVAKQSFIHGILLRLCLSLSCRIITVSPSMAQEVTSRFPKYRDKITFIPNGVDQAFLNHKSNASDGIGLSLITIANFISLKKIDTIIRALAKIDNASLTIIGDGPEKEALKSLANSLNVLNRTNFKGQLPPTEIPDELSKAKIFVLASESEGRPNVLIEAMAMRLAVVASDIPGIREVIVDGENGLLFSVGNSDELAQCIKRLMSEPELMDTIGDAGRSYILENKLTWSDAANRHVAVYKDLNESV